MTYLYDVNESEVYDPQSILDPMTSDLIRTAQSLYTAYYQTHGESTIVPLGVVVDRKTLRGHLIFTGQPILLPNELYISAEELGIEDSPSEDYWD